MNLYPFFPQCCPVCVIFAIRDLHIELQCVRKFHENRRREGRAFLVGVNEIASACAVCSRGVCGKQKCALVVGVLRHTVQQTLSSCLMCYCIQFLNRDSIWLHGTLSVTEWHGSTVVREQGVQFVSQSGVEISSLEPLMDELRSCNRVTSYRPKINLNCI
jgi:hypothetical protein